MSTPITRQSTYTTATILNGASLSAAIDLSKDAGGGVKMPATWTAASLGFYVCETSAGTFVPLKDKTGAVVELTVAASTGYCLPTDLYGWPYFKLWSQTSGSSVNQGGDRSIIVTTKG